LPVNQYKSSDTLFILGSGGSIQDLSPAAWETIRGCDSLAMNFWLYHPFVPTWFSCEIPRDTREAEVMSKLLERRAADYAGTAVLLKDVTKLQERFPGWHEKVPLAHYPHLYCLPSLSVAGKNRSSLRRHLRLQRWLGLFKREDTLWGLPMKRATIFLALAFAAKAGYRNVILCGIDLNNSDYFYRAQEYRRQDLPQLPEPPGKSEDLKKLYQASGVKMHHDPNPHIHNTMDPALNPLPIDEMLHALNEMVLKPAGIRCYVSLPSSALYPRMPVYFN
jgi:hypothetical protein